MPKLKRFTVKTDLANTADVKFSGYRQAANYYGQLVENACLQRGGTVSLEYEYLPGNFEITHYFEYKKDYELL